MSPTNLIGSAVCALLIAFGVLRALTVHVHAETFAKRWVERFGDKSSDVARWTLMTFAIAIATLGVAGSIWLPYPGLWGPAVLVFSVLWDLNSSCKIRYLPWIAPVEIALKDGSRLVLLGGALGTLIAYVLTSVASSEFAPPRPDRVRGVPYPLPPIPVTFGPHGVDIWLAVVSSIAALGSLVLAALAFSTARNAAKMAQAATVREYEMRLEEGIAHFLVGITEYLSPLADAIRNHTVAPPLTNLLPTIQLARLRARGEDAEVMERIAVLMNGMPAGLVSRRTLLTELVNNLRAWRTGSMSGAEIVNWVKSVPPS